MRMNDMHEAECKSNNNFTNPVSEHFKRKNDGE